MSKLKRYPQSGFTILELLTVLALAGILMAFSVPLLNNFIQRSHLEGFARESSLLIQSARFNAIKKANTQTIVHLDIAHNQVVSFLDANNDGVYNTANGDVELARYTLPVGVTFSAPSGDAGITQGLTTDPSSVSSNMAVLLEDGSIKTPGSFRFGDRNGNYLEVLISPQGTARVQLLKWDGTAWRAQGDNNQPWKWN